MLVNIISIVTDEKTGKHVQDQTAGEGLGWSEPGAHGLQPSTVSWGFCSLGGRRATFVVRLAGPGRGGGVGSEHDASFFYLELPTCTPTFFF